MKFRTKPVEVDAVQWFKHGDHPRVDPVYGTTNAWPCSICGHECSEHGFAKTSDGVLGCCPGDWIVTTPTGVYRYRKR